MNEHAPAKVTGQGRLKRLVKRALRTLLLAYVLVCVGVLLFQEKLIFPGASTQGAAESRVKPEPGETLVNLKSPSGVPLVGLFGIADSPNLGQTQGKDGAQRPTVLFFYGNAMCVNDADYIGDKFRSLGYHVMLIDYEGFGMSGGKPSEQGCYNAAESAYQYVLTRPDVDPHRLIAAGWSLGSAVAVDLAWWHRDDRTICALMTFSGMTSVVDVARHHYPFLPVGTLLRHRFMAIEKIRDITVPYFAGHGRHDSLIPFNCSQRLSAAYGGSREHLTFFEADTGHNDFFDEENKELTPRMAAFLKAVLAN